MGYRIIYLVGFMGCGKSTAGKNLAGILGWQFLDLDSIIEKKILIKNRGDIHPLGRKDLP